MVQVDLGDDDEVAGEAAPSKKKAAVGDKKPKAATPASASKYAAPRAPKAPGTSSSKKTKPATTSLSEDAQAAIAAVDAAAQKLPDESAVKFSFMPEGASGPAQSEPPNLNNKVSSSFL
ncbi:hypothetical protein DUNSADRAFT_13602, partial [Dunaliella salina]